MTYSFNTLAAKDENGKIMTCMTKLLKKTEISVFGGQRLKDQKTELSVFGGQRVKYLTVQLGKMIGSSKMYLPHLFQLSF